MASVVIGNSIESGMPVTISEESRYRGLYVIGTTGTGKSSLLENLIYQDMVAGEGLCVLEPEGNLTSQLLKRIPTSRECDVVLLDPSDREFPFSLNPFWCEDPSDEEQVDQAAASFVELFEKLWGATGSEGSSWGPQLAQLLRHIAIALAENPGHTMSDVPRLVTDADFRSRLLNNVKNPQTHFFWDMFGRLKGPEKDRIAQSTQNKVDEFLSYSVVRNIVSQPETSANFGKFMDEGKIVLVPLALGTLRGPIVNLLGSLFVLQILNASFARVRIPESARRPFYLYADEYQQFATTSFSQLLTGARKFRVATTIAHQVRMQLDQSNREAALNAANLIIFNLHGEDAEELAKQLDKTPPAANLSVEHATKSISQDPIPQLIQGHSNPRVRTLVSKTLAPLWRKYESLEPGDVATSGPIDEGFRPDLYRDGGIYYTTRENLRLGFELIRAYLVDIMEKHKDPWDSDALTEVVGASWLLRGVLGIHPDAHFYYPVRFQPGVWQSNDSSEHFRGALALIVGALAKKASGALTSAVEMLHAVRCDQLLYGIQYEILRNTDKDTLWQSQARSPYIKQVRRSGLLLASFSWQ